MRGFLTLNNIPVLNENKGIKYNILEVGERYYEFINKISQDNCSLYNLRFSNSDFSDENIKTKECDFFFKNILDNEVYPFDFFDYITCFDIYEYVDEMKIDVFFNQFQNMLKKNGVFLFRTKKISKQNILIDKMERCGLTVCDYREELPRNYRENNKLFVLCKK